MNVILFYSTLVLFSITSMWILINITKTKLLFLYIPVFLAIVAYSIFVYDSILGQPRHGPLPAGKFQILQYVIEDDKKIYLWIIPRDNEQKMPIAYELPYSENTHKKLEGVNAAMKRGTAEGEVKLKGKKASNSTENSREEQEMNFYDFVDQLMRDKAE